MNWLPEILALHRDAFIWAPLIAAMAGWLRGVTGFGSSLIIAPLLAGFIAPAEAVCISLMMGAAASLQMFGSQRGNIDLRTIAAVVPAGLVTLLPGMFLLHVSSPDLMRRVLGIATLAIVALMLLLPRFRLPQGAWPSLIAGGFSGAMMGATSMGGPPIVLYLMSRQGNSQQKRANIVIAVGVLEAAALLVFTIVGALTTSLLVLSALMLPSFLLGIHVGEEFFGRMKDKYTLVVFLSLAAVGLYAVLS